MLCFLAALLLVLTENTDAAVDFPTSQLIESYDIKNSDQSGVRVSCPGHGCTVYTTQMPSATVALYKADVLVTTLDKIYQKKNGFLEGFHLEGSADYVLKKTYAYVSDPVTVFIVADSVGPGAVTDIDAAGDLKSPGNRVVTVLSRSSGVTFFSFSYLGSAPPKIYSTGYDMITTCSAMCTARSVENAARSRISIVSALSTIDFGSTDAGNQCKLGSYIVDKTYAAIGESYVVMSPGCTGCVPFHNYNNVAFSTYDFQANAVVTKADVNFGDISISEGHELTLKATGQADTKVQGQLAQSYSYTASNLEVIVSWANPVLAKDYFYAQIDFVNGVARAFGVCSLLAVLLRI